MIAVKNYCCRKHSELLENFSLLAEKGKVPEGAAPGHNDGWGIGYYRAGRAVLHKSASSIIQDKDVFRRLIRDADGSPALIVHLRKSAWPRTSTSANAHPFLHDNFMFAHNGTIRDYKSLLPFLKIEKTPSEMKRALDTEIFFYFILSHIGPGIEEGLRRCVKHILRENSFSSLNFVLASDKVLFAYRQYSLNPSYYSLYHAGDAKTHIICSEPLGDSLSWKMLQRGSFLAL